MNYLQSSYYFDFESEPVQKLISPFKDKTLPEADLAIAMYLYVRDHWKYDPYTISLSEQNYRASTIAQKTTANCVEKSILLITCLRALGIPARLHLGKVKNHIAVERLIEKFGSNELTPHGMVNVYLNDQWLKVSPAFNKSLCKKFNVEPLEFDGKNNSFLQQYNSEGSRFMEYIEDYGHFEDVPLDFMKRNIKEHYPHIFDTKEPKTEFKL
ncbi:transglutaminase-like domain-containing protein [Poritiphilus flavus]|uniref:Transglutaminase n=1 Tax=Poritiphilus flavus TaxID=2697053 RepID=A0A6L9EGJ8_9FLAO|nr:transglutaminase-like domain-containing protein [Poritiphilus flavus]NAS13877.1 transglutaminase [Poritiphilus flavus]